MPRLSPDGWAVLSGVGGGRVKINDAIPPGLEALVGGGWTWRDHDRICGNGNVVPGAPESEWHLWQYSRSTTALERLDARPASWTYGGGGAWVAYIAGNPLTSYGSTGETWHDRVARDCAPSGAYLFTSHENDALYWAGQVWSNLAVESVQVGLADVVLWWGQGRFQALGMPAPLAPSAGGAGARFTTRGDQRWLCQWHSALGALVVYPWQTTGALEGFVLSTDERDFNHDIVARADGTLAVTTGVDQGESATRLYELELDAGRVRVNGGAWRALTLVPMTPAAPTDPATPPSTPIVSIPGYQVPAQASYGRRGYSGPYFATDIRTGNFVTPGNTEMVVNGTVLGGNQQVNRPVFVGLASTGNPPERLLGFLAGANDDSMGNAGIKACWDWHRKKFSPSELVRYYDATPIPQDFINACEREAIVQVQCYPRAGESASTSMARFVESVDRVIASGRRCGIARALNTKFGGLQLVLSVQDGLCAMVRARPAIVLDAWFSHGRWYRGIESGAAFSAELLAWEPVLGRLFTGLP